MTTTLAQAQAKLQEYYDAESACLLGHDVRLTSPSGIDRRIVLPDLASIRQGIAFWRGEVARLSGQASGRPTIGGIAFSSASFNNTGIGTYSGVIETGFPNN